VRREAPRTREKNVSRAVRGREWGGLWTSGGDYYN
jgi:hypothetical protein